MTVIEPSHGLGRRGRPARSRPLAAAARARGSHLALPVKIFLIGAALPGTIPLGPINLSAARIVLLVLLLPCLGRWLSGRAGPVRAADIAVLLFCLWYAVSYAATGGLGDAIEPAGINLIEIAGAYFLARCHIRTEADFRGMIRMLFLIMLALLPFAMLEAVTGRNLIAEIVGMVFHVEGASGDGMRWGLRRVSSVFNHPIMFGVVAAVLLPLTHLVLGRNISAARRWLQDLAVVCLALLSLSSAPIGLTVMLIALMGWDAMLRSFRYRWHLIALVVIVAYLSVELLSSQSPVQFYIHYFTFDGQTGWYRLLIWEYGTASVSAHPLFGIGFAEWARPSWMTSSIDNFWLVHFVRTGYPGGVLMLAAFGLAAVAVGRAKVTGDAIRRCRLAYLLVLFGLFFTGATVHFWGTALVLFLFFLGSGLWIVEGDPKPSSPGARRGRSAATSGGRSYRRRAQSLAKP